VPAVERRGIGRNARRRLRLSRLGIRVEWEEEPFEWVSPHRFSVMRRYLKGPVATMLTSASLRPREGGGTLLAYSVEARPRNVLGRVAIPLQIGLLSRRRFAAVFRRYDEILGSRGEPLPPRQSLAPGGESRIAAARTSLVDRGASPELAGRLCTVVSRADELTVSRLRPYALADAWGADRRETLELCLQATRGDLLELRWELLCPLCRGAAESEGSLDAVGRPVHCETCLIDFTADFERSVEVTFRPSAAIRSVEPRDFCVGGPQLTPHVVAQQLVPPGVHRSLEVRVEPGRYRLRSLAVPGALPVTVGPGGESEAEARLEPDGWAPGELFLDQQAKLGLANATADEQLLVLERTAWSDQAATAADVTSLQVFRDLFATEALRPGEPIAVGSLSVVFTDLRDSTRYYRDVGDAPAFGAVLEHLDLLRGAVAAEDGAVVKAMGDAIMAVFPRPLAAVRAMLAAHEAVAGRPLELKVGIHAGRCIAVNQNGVLDYFGSTVNLAARLAGLSAGGDLVVSDAVLADPELRALGLRAEPIEGVVKGFEGESLSLWRIEP
jgi:class 3 adenylate cyclase